MTLRTTRKSTAVAGAALTALLMVLGLSAQAGDSARPSGGRGLVHRNGKAVSSAGPTAKTYSIGGHALEPTLGIDPGGDVYFAAAGFDSIGGQPGTQILHSANGGESWDNVSPRARPELDALVA